MYKTHGRLRPADKKEVANLKDRYFRCEKCHTTILLKKVEFAGEQICAVCGGNLYEINPYKTKTRLY